MSHADRHAWLVCYDIGSPERWARLYRLLCERAVPVQFSVFVTVGTVKDILVLLSDLRPLVHATEDDLRIYKLAKRATIDMIGEARSPDGVELLGEPADVPPEVCRLMWRPTRTRQLVDN